MKKIVLFSNKHKLDDNRIVELEAESISKNDFNVVVYANKAGKEVQRSSNIILKNCAGSLYGCLKQCLGEKADLYIFHDPGLLILAVILRFMGKKSIFDAHENYVEKLKTRIPVKYPHLKMFRMPIVKLWWIYEKLSVSLLTAKICADRTVEQKYGKRTYLLPNMPSARFFSNIPERTVDDGKFHLIYVGTITWDRGIIQAAEALSLCKNKNVVLNIIGDTDDLELKEKIRGYDHVIWHGRVEWMKLKNYLVNSDAGIVLLQPTEAYLYCYGENIVKLWEYMSIGLPVILSDFPHLKSLNEMLDIGITVKPDDVHSIAEGIDWLIANPSERLRFGKNGRSLVIEKYNAEYYAEKFIDFINYYTG